jgi:hypothetical protein
MDIKFDFNSISLPEDVMMFTSLNYDKKIQNIVSIYIDIYIYIYIFNIYIYIYIVKTKIHNEKRM